MELHPANDEPVQHEHKADQGQVHMWGHTVRPSTWSTCTHRWGISTPCRHEYLHQQVLGLTVLTQNHVTGVQVMSRHQALIQVIALHDFPRLTLVFMRCPVRFLVFNCTVRDIATSTTAVLCCHTSNNTLCHTCRWHCSNFMIQWEYCLSVDSERNKPKRLTNHN